MIKEFIKRVFGRRTKPMPKTDHATHDRNTPRRAPKVRGEIEPVIVDAKRHGINQRMLSRGARETCEGLQRAGFKAFVVGGAVRDLLLDAHPKDFDVATDATPEEVRNVFRRSRIIGRRFRLVHVMFGADVVEVSTFRAHFQQPAASDELDDDGEKRDKTDEHGRILSDNVFGSQSEDALRRDFTANALFYDPVAEEIWDYQGGLKDVAAKTLRMIGDPEVRYREDPVRMLRAARLSAKTGFTIEKATSAPIAKMKPLLTNVPHSRLFDEILKLLLSGHSVACVDRLRQLGLHHGLLPLLDAALDDEASRPFAVAALQATDDRIREAKRVNPAFLLAALLWGSVERQTQSLVARGMKEVPALHEAMHEVLDKQRSILAIPRRYDAVIKEIWLMQPRFLRRSGGSPFRLVDHPRYRAAYDFYLLRSSVAGTSDSADATIARWWNDFAQADDHMRSDLLAALTPVRGGKGRGPRRGGNDSIAKNEAPEANPLVIRPSRDPLGGQADRPAPTRASYDDMDESEVLLAQVSEEGAEQAAKRRRRGGRRRGGRGRSGGGSAGESGAGGTN